MHILQLTKTMSGVKSKVSRKQQEIGLTTGKLSFLNAEYTARDNKRYVTLKAWIKYRPPIQKPKHRRRGEKTTER